MISFKNRHFKKEIILMLILWYLAYALSYRDIEELAAERGLKVDHSTVNRWVIKYSPQLEDVFTRAPEGIKKITKPMMGFKAFHSAKATLSGIELHHMLRKKQHLNSANLSIFEQFSQLAA